MPHRWYVGDMDKRLFLNATLLSQLAVIVSLHNRPYIYCDIKPANFMIPVDSSSPVTFLVNFSLAQ